jgi:glycine/D-amino acid oxidase-like deaminating enzyme
MASDAHTQETIGRDIPGMILIIGSGVFGLSTAYALCRRKEFKKTKIVVIDRWPFPAPDGASVFNPILANTRF